MRLLMAAVCRYLRHSGQREHDAESNSVPKCQECPKCGPSVADVGQHQKAGRLVDHGERTAPVGTMSKTPSALDTLYPSSSLPVDRQFAPDKGLPSRVLVVPRTTATRSGATPRGARLSGSHARRTRGISRTHTGLRNRPIQGRGQKGRRPLGPTGVPTGVDAALTGPE